MKVMVFTEDVGESLCEYNIGSMQNGCDTEYDMSDEGQALYLLDAVRSLRPGEALVVIRERK